ncbi:MAG TPA: hypothetical protein ENK46_08110 [Flavobacteriia bacterium]|nr:hypothetical protein [Flavobacteriia bacterium]
MYSKQKYLIFLFIPLFAFSVHKYYISLTKIDFIKDKNEVQVTMRIFIDDLQATLNTAYHTNIELALPYESKEIDSLINTYLLKKFILTINGNKKEYTYLGKEYEDDVVYLYLEAENITKITAIKVKNSMLMDEFESQKNIIKLHINNTKRTFLLTKKKDNDLLQF